MLPEVTVGFMLDNHFSLLYGSVEMMKHYKAVLKQEKICVTKKTHDVYPMSCISMNGSSVWLKGYC